MDDFSFNLANEEVKELATNFVEKYTDYVENLPFDLQRKVTRLREIDCSCREILTEIESLYENFVKEKDLAVGRKATNTLLKIQVLFGRCQELGDEKISIVQQVAEIIENKKKAVEHASHRFKSYYKPDQKSDFVGKRELNKIDYHKGSKRPRRNRDKHDKDKLSQMSSLASPYDDSDFVSTSTISAHVSGEKQRANATQDTSNHKTHETAKKEESSHRKQDKSDRKEWSPTSSTSSGSNTALSLLSTTHKSSSKTNSKASLSAGKATLSTTSINGANKTAKRKKKTKKMFKPVEKPSTRSPSPQPDLPIDPDEPTYCLCDQVSFGQMIGCDNKKCPIEWFHFSCVGLSHKPKGKWYCPDCSRDMRDRKRESRRDHR